MEDKIKRLEKLGFECETREQREEKRQKRPTATYEASMPAQAKPYKKPVRYPDGTALFLAVEIDVPLLRNAGLTGITHAWFEGDPDDRFWTIPKLIDLQTEGFIEAFALKTTN